MLDFTSVIHDDDASVTQQQQDPVFCRRMTGRGVLREVCLVGGGLLVVLLAFFWEAVFLGRALLPVDLIYAHDPVWREVALPDVSAPRNPLLSDQVYQGYPWRAYIYRWLSQGEFPLWNASILGGTSLIGNDQSALFFPVNVLSYPLPLATSFTFTAVSRLLIAGLSTYGYLRLIGRSVSAAYLGALGFMLGGFLVVWLGYPIVNVAIWLPTILLLVELIFNSGSHRWVGMLALVMGAQYLGGHVETSFHILLVSAAYALCLAGFHWRQGVPRVALQRLSHCTLAAVLGLGIGAIQLLPFIEQLTKSSAITDRAVVHTTPTLFYPGFWRELATAPTLLFPTLLGSPTEPEYWAFTANYNEYTAYVGTIPLVLSIVGAICFRTDGRHTFWLVAGLLSLAVAYRLPIFEAVNHFPLFEVVVNGRLRLIFSFAAVTLGATGMDWLLAQSASRDFSARRPVRRFVRLTGLAACISGVVLLSAHVGLIVFRQWILAFGRDYVLANIHGQPGFSLGLEDYLAKVERYYQVTVERFSPVHWPTYVPVVSMVILVTVVWLVSTRRLNVDHAAILLPTVALAELLIFGIGYNPAVRPSLVFPSTPVIEFLRERAGVDRVVGLGFALMPNSSMIWGLQDVRGYENVRLARSWTLLRDIDGREPFGEYLLVRHSETRLLDLLSARYIVAASASSAPFGARSRAIFQSQGVTVYENLQALPRAYVVAGTRVVSEPTEALALMRGQGFDPRSEVVLEAQEQPPLYGLRPGQTTVEIKAYRPNEVQIEATLEWAGFLVLTDAYDDGWSVFVDGHRVPMYRANYAFRAVRLEPGAHRVEFVYCPWGFRFGMVVTILCLCISVVFLLRLTLRRVPQGRSSNG